MRIPTLISTITFIHGPKNHHSTDSQGKKQFHINLTFVLSTYRVLITLTDDEHWFDLLGTNFGDLIGFEKKIINKTEYGTKLPNITNSIDVLNINTSAIKDSIVSGVNTNTIDTIGLNNFTRSCPFIFEPKRTSFSLFHRLILLKWGLM